jgi:hypothetical protein
MAVALKKKAPASEQAFDLDSVLSSAAAPADSKSKSKVPVLTVSPDVQAKAKRLRELHAEIESLTSMFETISTEVVEAVSPLRENLCKSGYVSSVKIPDGAGSSIGMSWTDSYSKIDLANRDAIMAVVGDQFGDFFRLDKEIKVKGEIPDEMLRELVEAVGSARFAEFFEVKRWLKPTTRYTQESLVTFTPEQRQQLGQAGVRQYKASIKCK